MRLNACILQPLPPSLIPSARRIILAQPRARPFSPYYPLASLF